MPSSSFPLSFGLHCNIQIEWSFCYLPEDDRDVPVNVGVQLSITKRKGSKSKDISDKIFRVQDEVRIHDGAGLAVSLGNDMLEGSDGSGVDIFIESGDCDLEFGFDSGGCIASAFLIADGPSGIEDWGRRAVFGCASSVVPAVLDFDPFALSS